MGIFNRIKCFFGFHEAENFINTDACLKGRQCHHCDKILHSEPHHTFGDLFYSLPNDCYQSHVCKTCGEREDRARLVHQPDYDFQYCSASSCAQKLTCMRCNQALAEKITHTFFLDGSSECLMVCKRCREKAPRHNWTNVGAGLRQCQQCGKQEPYDPNWEVRTSPVQNPGEYNSGLTNRGR